MTPTASSLYQAALQLRDALSASAKRIVLAESCTGGNIAATLAGIPGISDYLCGSFVVYRNESKADWLGIDRAMLDDPAIGPVSQAVTRSLAARSIQRTPEADLALAVTGHLGPGVSPPIDGTIYCALKERDGRSFEASGRLSSPSPAGSRDAAGRRARQQEATLWALEHALRWLTEEDPHATKSSCPA